MAASKEELEKILGGSYIGGYAEMYKGSASGSGYTFSGYIKPGTSYLRTLAREFIELPNGELILMECREAENGSFRVAYTRGVEGGPIPHFDSWEQAGVKYNTAPVALRRMQALLQELLEGELEAGEDAGEDPSLEPMPLWRCPCGVEFQAPEGAPSTMFHECGPEFEYINCTSLGDPGHDKCPKRVEEVALEEPSWVCVKHGLPREVAPPGKWADSGEPAAFICSKGCVCSVTCKGNPDLVYCSFKKVRKT